MRKFLVGAGLLVAVVSLPAQQMVTETRDPAQQQDADFEKSVKEWTGTAVLQQPAGRSPAGREGHPDAEGRPRLLTSARPTS